jgi:hypothetical protein
MKKTLLLLLVIAFCFSQDGFAQKKTHEDSTEVINAASRYAAAFRLRNRDLKKFHEEHFAFTSDYFKPDSRRIPQVLMVDSLFVKTYRADAYNRALDQQSFPEFPAMLTPPHVRPGESQNIYTTGQQLTAQHDAKEFALDPALLVRFKTEHFPATSDYFKPTAAYTSNSSLLTDSSYVQTFRAEAYNRAYHQRVNPTGHGFLIGGIIAVGTAIVVLIAVALSRVQVY